MIGQLLNGRYRITAALSSGSFGKTYLAEDTQRPGNPTCVVKQLQPEEPALLQLAKKLFNQEAETLEKLGEHPQIPRLFAYFESGGEFYLVQEYVAGKPLNKKWALGKMLPEKEILIFVEELLEILKFVQGYNVIHRDISPKNIMQRDSDRKFFLIDFGAVKQVTASSNRTLVIGTPGYMPKEQTSGQPHFKSDVYAVGAIAIQALTGKLPPQLPLDPHTEEIIWRNQAQVSPELGDILDKMVRQDFRQRYSAEEALQAVKILTNPPPPKKWWLFGAIAAVSAAAVAVIFILASRPNSGARLPLDGQALNRALTAENRSDNPLDNTYSNVYVFEGKRGQQVTIEMKSQEFDPYLIVRDADGNQIAFNDDISPDDFNAKISVTLPKDGTYTVIARSKEAGETGAYSLRAVRNKTP